MAGINLDLYNSWDRTPYYQEACRITLRLGEQNRWNPPRAMGATGTDQTDFQIGSGQYNLNNLPPIFYIVNPPRLWQEWCRSRRPGPKRNATGAVMMERWPAPSKERRPLLDFPIFRNINQISTNVEWWLLEFWFRSEPLLRWEDISMRMEYVGDRVGREPRKFHNMLNMRCERVRVDFGMTSWRDNTTFRSSKVRTEALAKLSQAQVTSNSSAGTTPGSRDATGLVIPVPKKYLKKEAEDAQAAPNRQRRRTLQDQPGQSVFQVQPPPSPQPSHRETRKRRAPKISSDSEDSEDEDQPPNAKRQRRAAFLPSQRSSAAVQPVLNRTLQGLTPNSRAGFGNSGSQQSRAPSGQVTQPSPFGIPRSRMQPSNGRQIQRSPYQNGYRADPATVPSLPPYQSEYSGPPLSPYNIGPNHSTYQYPTDLPTSSQRHCYGQMNTRPSDMASQSSQSGHMAPAAMPYNYGHGHANLVLTNMAPRLSMTPYHNNRNHGLHHITTMYSWNMDAPSPVHGGRFYNSSGSLHVDTSPLGTRKFDTGTSTLTSVDQYSPNPAPFMHNHFPAGVPLPVPLSLATGSSGPSNANTAPSPISSNSSSRLSTPPPTSNEPSPSSNQPSLPSAEQPQPASITASSSTCTTQTAPIETTSLEPDTSACTRQKDAPFELDEAGFDEEAFVRDFINNDFAPVGKSIAEASLPAGAHASPKAIDDLIRDLVSPGRVVDDPDA